MECNFENCGYYTDGDCNICGMGISGEDTFCRLCKDNPNCYYKQLSELKAENDKLKEEIETRDNLVEHFRKESLSWANISNKYQKDKTKLEQTLQEIKKIANHWQNRWLNDIDERQGFDEILDIIIKAEEE